MGSNTIEGRKKLIDGTFSSTAIEKKIHESGYLHKKTKNGKWQRRWFETNGCFLTYYKRQNHKLLAALNLPQVGDITLLDEKSQDGPNGYFTIQLNERIYTIMAKDYEDASLWVEGLKWRQEGNMIENMKTAKLTNKIEEPNEIETIHEDNNIQENNEKKDIIIHTNNEINKNNKQMNTSTIDIKTIIPEKLNIINQTQEKETEIENKEKMKIDSELENNTMKTPQTCSIKTCCIVS